METSPLQLITAAESDPGRDPAKQVNEDAYCLCELETGLLAVVCDGMGGHFGGRLASSAAVQVIEQQWRTRATTTEPRALLTESIQKAGAEVYALGGTAPMAERPGTTCVAAWLSNGSLQVAHVGDSRAYRYRNGQLLALTVDHSMVEAWVAAGHLSREQAKGHPDAHRITRALGIASEVEVELRPTEDLRAADRILLCTDGLTDLVTVDELAQHLAAQEPLPQIASRLLQLANQRGGHDNITVVLVDVVCAGGPTAIVAGTQEIAAPLLGQTDVLPKAAHRNLAKTVPIDAVQHTVLMDGPARLDAAAPPTIRQLADPSPHETRRIPPSIPPGFYAQEKAKRTLWLVLAAGLLLSLLAILVRFLRHKNG